MTPEYDPEQLAAAAAQVTPPPVATGMGEVPAGPSPYEADIAALKAMITAQQERLDALEAERRERNMPALVSTAQALRDLIGAHETTSGLAVPGALFRLADDAVAAAAEAVRSGDVSAVRDIAGRIGAALARIHPGGGDHPFHRQAVEFARDHLPEACDQVQAPQPQASLALGSSQAPAPVIQGSRLG